MTHEELFARVCAERNELDVETQRLRLENLALSAKLKEAKQAPQEVQAERDSLEKRLDVLTSADALPESLRSAQDVASRGEIVKAYQHFHKLPVNAYTALNAVLTERAEQDIQWGGPSHDDSHVCDDWSYYIRKQINKADESGETDLTGARSRFVKAAALALAAIESIDRRTGVMRVSGPAKTTT